MRVACGWLVGRKPLPSRWLEGGLRVACRSHEGGFGVAIPCLSTRFGFDVALGGLRRLPPRLSTFYFLLSLRGVFARPFPWL